MIPVTVLTGFLGSGKTTLLARLLRSPAFARAAVIINEFGEVGIDHDLVAASEESFVELETGCICCMVRGDLEATLADLVARRQAGALPPFERIVIETSGLADPAPVLNAIMAETGRGAGIRLAGVITTVDAVTGAATLASEAQSARQVAVADRLILTKTDLAGGRGEDGLMGLVRQLNPRAPVHVAVKGAIDPVLLTAATNEWPAEGMGSATPKTAAAVEDTGTPPSLLPAIAHDSTLGFVALKRVDAMPALALTLFLEALADHVGADLLRMKGLVRIRERPDRPAVVHGVQHVFHEPEWLDGWPSEDQGTRLVLIGRGLSKLWLETLLEAIVSEVGEIDGSARPRMR